MSFAESGTVEGILDGLRNRPASQCASLRPGEFREFLEKALDGYAGAESTVVDIR